MLEQVLVWIIVAIAAAYAVRAIARSFRKGSDHCSNCGISERKDGPANAADPGAPIQESRGSPTLAGRPLTERTTYTGLRFDSM